MANDNKNLENLNNFPLIKLLPSKSVQLLVQKGNFVTLQQDQLLFQEGSKQCSMYLILEGELIVFSDETIIANRGSGEFIGEMSMIDPQIRSASIKSTCKTELFEIDKVLFDSCLATNPVVIMNLLKTVTIRFREDLESIKVKNKKLHNSEKVLKKIEETNRALLETTDICLKEIHKNDGPGYTLIFLSPAGQKQLGITNIEKYYGGPYPAEVYPEEANKATTEALDRLVCTGESTQVECELFDIHGNSVWYLTTYSIQRKNEAGEVVSITGASQNITQRKKDQEILAKYSKELAISNQELQDFAAIASHDLQEPLRKISIFGDRILESATNLDEKGRDYIQRMQKSIQRMSRFITDLLDFSMITTVNPPHEKVNLVELVKTVDEQIDHIIQSSNGKVNFSNLPVVEGNKSQLNQLFSNLIINSLKFSRGGKPPVVNISGRKIENNYWEIAIEDNGIGIDEEHADRIFKPFQRLHGRSEYEGSGFGLTICKKIVDRHNGSISVKSKLGEGTTFIIMLPEKQK